MSRLEPFNAAKESFIGADLHVHTPASDCYKGPKNGEEYLEILRKYKDKEIKVIAITDHNTFKGYRTLMKLKEELANKEKVLKELRDEIPEVNRKYNNVTRDLLLFDNLLIIPGIEFEAKPGIHLLFLFNPETDLIVLERYLEQCGYSDGSQGKKNPDNIPNIDVIDALEGWGDRGAICIAAHVDSDKGIYNNLSGQYRAEIFKSPFLTAISYNNPDTKERIEELLKNKEYRRNEPLTFLQCSDYHGESNKPGRRISYLNLESLDYRNVCLALQNPECVSFVKNPKVKNIIQKAMDNPNTICLKHFDEQKIKMSMCALLNEGYGVLVIGVNPKKELIGISKTIDDCKSIIKHLTQDIEPSFSPDIQCFEYGEGTIVLVRITGGVCSLYRQKSDEVYVLKGGLATLAKPDDVETIVEKKLLQRLKRTQRAYQSRIDYLLDEVMLLKETSDQFSVVNKIEKSSVFLRQVMDLVLASTSSFDVNLLEDKYNGDASGNIAYLLGPTRPHLPYAYLRCSCPKFWDEIMVQSSQNKFSGERLVIVPGGAAFIMDSPGDWAIVSGSMSNLPVLVLKVKEEFKQAFSETAILGWLKSSVALWYAYVSTGSVDYSRPEVYSNMIIPESALFSLSGRVDLKIREILIRESKFLEDAKSVLPDDIDNFICDHNNKVGMIALKIEKDICKEFNISEEELKIVKSFYKRKELYSVLTDDKLVKPNSAEDQVAVVLE